MSDSFILVTMIFINEFSREAEKILPEEIKNFIKDIFNVLVNSFLSLVHSRGPMEMLASPGICEWA